MLWCLALNQSNMFSFSPVIICSRLTPTVKKSGWLLSNWSLKIMSMKELVDCWPRLAAVHQQPGFVHEKAQCSDKPVSPVQTHKQ